MSATFLDDVDTRILWPISVTKAISSFDGTEEVTTVELIWDPEFPDMITVSRYFNDEFDIDELAIFGRELVHKALETDGPVGDFGVTLTAIPMNPTLPPDPRTTWIELALDEVSLLTPLTHLAAFWAEVEARCGGAS